MKVKYIKNHKRNTSGQIADVTRGFAKNLIRLEIAIEVDANGNPVEKEGEEPEKKLERAKKARKGKK